MTGTRAHSADGQPGETIDVRARFDAFISYSHANVMIAGAIQRGLHQLARPLWRPRALRVFLDRTDLAASPELWGRIMAGLDQSRFLVAILSPDAARSAYVQRELDHWISGGKADRLLLVLAGGDLVWDEQRQAFDPSRSTAAPPAVTEPGVFAEEPLYVVLTWVGIDDRLSLDEPRFRSAIGDLAAPIHGQEKAELDSYDIREHRRLRRLRRIAMSTLATLLALAVLAAVLAVGQARRADREASAARQQAAVAEAQLAATRSTAAGTVWGALAFAVEAELRTPQPLTEARSVMARALQRLGRLPARPLGYLETPGTDLDAISWSPDKAQLATGDSKGAVRIWDTRTLKPRGAPLKLTISISILAWSPHEGLLAAAGSDGMNETVRLVDLAHGVNGPCPAMSPSWNRSPGLPAEADWLSGVTTAYDWSTPPAESSSVASHSFRCKGRSPSRGRRTIVGWPSQATAECRSSTHRTARCSAVRWPAQARGCFRCRGRPMADGSPAVVRTR